MTMSYGSATPASAADAGHARSRALMVWLTMACIAAAALMLRAIVPFNVDVSWWMIIADHVFDGQRLYVDILETNPPLAGVVYFAADAFARLAGVRSEIAVNGLIFAMIAASMTTAAWMLRGSSLREHPARYALALWTLALLAVLPMYDFGQREHLALLTFLPAMAVSILRAERVPVSLAAMVVAGVAAALTMAIKPHFIFAVGACIIAAALWARSWRALFAGETWIAGTLSIIYGIATYVAFPEYFTLIYPLVRDVYLQLKAPISAILMTGAIGLWVGSLIVVFVLTRSRGSLDAALFVTLAASAGFAASFIAQRKGWGYHAYPMVALGLLAAGCAVASIERAAARLRIAALALLTAMFANACLWFNASIDMRRVQAEVARISTHPKLLVLSAAATVGHPMARELGAVWISRQAAFWVREIVRRAQADGYIDQAEAERLQPYIAWERNGIVADVRKNPPDVVLIDKRDSDWSKWVANDAKLSALLAPYTRASTIDGIEIRSRP